MVKDSITGASYDELMANFEWSDRWAYFEGGRESFNITHECLLRYLPDFSEAIGARVFREDGEVDEYTFGELAGAASGVNHLLDDLHIARGASIGIAVSPGLAYFGAIYGVLMGGRVAVPGSQILLPAALHARFTAANIAVALLDDIAQLPAEAEGQYRTVIRNEVEDLIKGGSLLPAVATHSTDPAIYVYTSGTTGVPKQVTIPHQGLTLYTTVVGKLVLGLTRDDRYLATYSNGYLGGIAWGVLVPMSLGAAAGIYSGRLTGVQLAHHIVNRQISAMHCPPTAYRRIVTSGEAVGRSVRSLGYSGEPLSKGESTEIAKLFGVSPRSQYGASEVGLVAIDYCLSGYTTRPGSLGKPLPKTEVMILTEDGSELPRGEVGRITVQRKSGPVPTGDTGYVDSDGYLWFVGRADDLILSAGYTISPTEVESAIRTLPWVEDVAVVGAADVDRYQQVIAFVQRKGHSESVTLAEDEVAGVVRQKVGAHAAPRMIHFVQEFPRADGEKIKKRELIERFIGK